LRRTLLTILERRSRLSSAELAKIAYGGARIVVRPGHGVNVTVSQVTSVRRALRRLVARGRVASEGRCRRWKLFSLTEARP
jgi:hypothetical protein